MTKRNIMTKNDLKPEKSTYHALLLKAYGTKQKAVEAINECDILYTRMDRKTVDQILSYRSRNELLARRY